MPASGPVFGGTTGQLELRSFKYHCLKASVNNAESAHSFGYSGRAATIVSQRGIAINKAPSEAQSNEFSGDWSSR
jgi:hypothetical protein